MAGGSGGAPDFFLILGGLWSGAPAVNSDSMVIPTPEGSMPRLPVDSLVQLQEDVASIARIDDVKKIYEQLTLLAVEHEATIDPSG